MNPCGRARWWGLLLALSSSVVMAQQARLEVEPLEATIGDRLQATLTLELPAEFEFEPQTIGPRLGPFSVFSGKWRGPLPQDGGARYTWSGALSAFETGELEVPAIRLSLSGPEGASVVSTEPVGIAIVTVLDEVEAAELADIKPPVSVAPDFGPLLLALGIFVGLLLTAGLVWWLQRRYAAKLAAVPASLDPFRRMPPHEWIYRELQHLLDRRIPEGGDIDLFYSELSRILKRYLSGRYRIDLLEHTTEEVPLLLEQAGASRRAIDDVRAFLSACDRVKFAGDRPDSTAWRAAVETIYGIVDETKPVAVAPTADARGAA